MVLEGDSEGNDFGYSVAMARATDGSLTLVIGAVAGDSNTTGYVTSYAPR